MSLDIFTVVKVTVLGFAAIVASATTALPWWFKFSLTVSRDGGRTTEDVELDVGLFFMDQGSITQTDLIFIDKTTNAHTVPEWYKMGQLFYGAGSMGLLVCFGTSVVYMLRKYRSATGEMCLAGALSPCAISLTLGVLFSILGTVGSPSAKWEQFPVPNYYTLEVAEPNISINFVVYAAGAAVAFAIGAAIVFWMHACAICSHVEKIRYQMLMSPLTDDERGVGPGMTYNFNKQNPGFRYDGYSKPVQATPGRMGGYGVDI